MTAFKYVVLDADGKKTTGVIEADSVRDARSRLRDRGFFPVTVTAQGQTRRSIRFLPKGRFLRYSELCLLTRQWATLLASGLNLEQALNTLVEQSERQAVGEVLAGVRNEILAGFSLRAALDRFPSDFPMIYRASVAAGERSGDLAKVMLQLAEHLEQQNILRQKTLQALIYPSLVALVATAVIIGLITYVVPAVVNVFQQGKQDLPVLTKWLILVSWFVREWGWMVLVVGLVTGALGHRALQDDALRMRWDRTLLSLPILGRYLRTLDATRFASTLAILTASGVPLLAALDACVRVVGRLPLGRAILDAAARVREGAPLSRALAHTRQFPPLLLHMIASGEATGQLDASLDRAARLQQTELESRTSTFIVMVEPLLLIAMGGVVLVIVLAIMQPIINMNVMVR